MINGKTSNSNKRRRTHEIIYSPLFSGVNLSLDVIRILNVRIDNFHRSGSSRMNLPNGTSCCGRAPAKKIGICTDLNDYPTQTFHKNTRYRCRTETYFGFCEAFSWSQFLSTVSVGTKSTFAFPQLRANGCLRLQIYGVSDARNSLFCCRPCTITLFELMVSPMEIVVL